MKLLALAATAMRHLLVDHARRRGALKRGGELEPVTIDDAEPLAEGPRVDLLALDEALEDLAKLDPRPAHIVELRYFAGLTIREVAQVLKVGTTTVENDWAMARAWLARRLAPGEQA